MIIRHQTQIVVVIITLLIFDRYSYRYIIILIFFYVILGKAFVNTLFGQFFHISILPKSQSGPYDFFGDLTYDMGHVDVGIWNCFSNYQNLLFSIIKQLLVQSVDNKVQMMQWFGKCLHANRSRGHLWNNLYSGIEDFSHDNGSDAFMIGVASILVRLCAPLCLPTLKVIYILIYNFL